MIWKGVSRQTKVSSYMDSQTHAPKHTHVHTITDSKGLKGNLTIPSCTAIPFYREFKKLVSGTKCRKIISAPIKIVNDYFAQWPWYVFLCIMWRKGTEGSYPILLPHSVAAQMRTSCQLKHLPGYTEFLVHLGHRGLKCLPIPAKTNIFYAVQSILK